MATALGEWKTWHDGKVDAKRLLECILQTHNFISSDHVDKSNQQIKNYDLKTDSAITHYGKND